MEAPTIELFGASSMYHVKVHVPVGLPVALQCLSLFMVECLFAVSKFDLIPTLEISTNFFLICPNRYLVSVLVYCDLLFPTFRSFFFFCRWWKVCLTSNVYRRSHCQFNYGGWESGIDARGEGWGIWNSGTVFWTNNILGLVIQHLSCFCLSFIPLWTRFYFAFTRSYVLAVNVCIRHPWETITFPGNRLGVEQLGSVVHLLMWWDYMREKLKHSCTF